jgi:hypothetical protein
MNETMRAYILFFGAFTTMMNSYCAFASSFRVTFFNNSLFRGFSMNQQEKSFSALLINVPSLY